MSTRPAADARRPGLAMGLHAAWAHQLISGVWPRILSHRRLAVGALQLVVLTISVAAIAELLDEVNPAAVLRQSAHTAWPLVALAVLLNVPTTLLRARRSQILLRHFGQHVGWHRMNGVNLAGQTLSWLTPAAAGDFARPYMWRSHDRVPVSAGVATVLYERTVTLLQMGTVGGVLAAALYLPAPLTVGAGVAGVALLAAPWWVSRLARRALPGPDTGRRGLLGALWHAMGQLEDLGVSARLGAEFTLLTLLVFAVSGLQILVLVHAVGATVAPAVAIAVFCLSQAAGSISMLPFGVGSIDVTTIALLQIGGVAVVPATAAAILVRVAMTLPLGAAGALSMLWVGRPRLHPTSTDAHQAAGRRAVPSIPSLEATTVPAAIGGST